MADDRPNIILIITDQQRLDTINALGFDYVDTPNLDRLVQEGVTFRNCHVTAPSYIWIYIYMLTVWFLRGIHSLGP